MALSGGMGPVWMASDFVLGESGQKVGGAVPLSEVSRRTGLQLGSMPQVGKPWGTWTLCLPCPAHGGHSMTPVTALASVHRLREKVCTRPPQPRPTPRHLEAPEPRDTLKLVVRATHPVHGDYFYADLLARAAPPGRRAARNEEAGLGVALSYAFMPHRVALLIYWQVGGRAGGRERGSAGECAAPHRVVDRFWTWSETRLGFLLAHLAVRLLCPSGGQASGQGSPLLPPAQQGVPAAASGERGGAGGSRGEPRSGGGPCGPQGPAERPQPRRQHGQQGRERRRGAGTAHAGRRTVPCRAGGCPGRSAAHAPAQRRGREALRVAAGTGVAVEGVRSCGRWARARTRAQASSEGCLEGLSLRGASTLLAAWSGRGSV